MDTGGQRDRPRGTGECEKKTPLGRKSSGDPVPLRWPTWCTKGMESIRVPKASPDPLSELETLLGPFLHLFRRKQTVQSMERYVTGLLTDLRRNLRLSDHR